MSIPKNLTNNYLDTNNNLTNLELSEKDGQNSSFKLKEYRKNQNPKCQLLVIDNFYNNAHEVREYILQQDFKVTGNFPGKRTKSYANEHLKNIIQSYILPFGGTIVDFPIPTNDEEATKIYNGSFQYTTALDRSWIHTDEYNNWAAVLYLTPDAPVSSGTGFFQFYNGVRDIHETTMLDCKKQTDHCSQDLTKWTKTDTVANVFNRLIIFNSKNFHMSLDYFGDSKENGRLFQLFFFSTDK